MRNYSLFFITFILSFFIPLYSAYAEKIVIDPGHGGYDPGAIGVNGLQEKQVNLDIAQKLQQELATLGYETVMTRTTDVFVSLQRRVEIANEHEADLFISIHSNAHSSPIHSGSLVLYYDDQYPNANYPASLEMRKLTPLSKQLAHEVLEQLVETTNLNHLGIIPSSMYVIRTGSVPSILVETGFLSNEHDAMLLEQPSFRQKAATGIAKGIVNYIPTFLDIQGHWAQSDIELLHEGNIVKGITATQFQPNGNLTRAQYITLLNNVFAFTSTDVHDGEDVVDSAGEDNENVAVDSVEEDSADDAVDSAERDAANDVVDSAEEDIANDAVDSVEEDIANDAVDSVVEDIANDVVDTVDENIAVDADNEDIHLVDVPENHWAYTEIEKAVQLGFLNGYDDGTYRPDQVISRAEVAVLFDSIWENETLSPSDIYYEDVMIGSWYEEAIYSLTSAKLFTGTSQHIFSPEKPMTRAEAASVISRYLLRP
ncbi:N-acetylmuramoyl-L-alanine amidase [Longirhabdus pacifica]|uniref:N-acetylmuramoyl-L-alanine amidase n=1 Tax=Longirhabdus pacifica TaxID=2305227 RepID=UPI0010092B49|nr:N-acetylmuramoyl-L-alanine amidase [Longirhabdus pacifica]